MSVAGHVTEAEVKRQVQAFYDSIGWKVVGDGLYQNARYEDLRPVSREYIHRCHLRVRRHLPAGGKLLLDAGSGPVQYPEYLEYSAGFSRRVCLDISRLALSEARARLGTHGRYVVGDLANLPFPASSFDGVVSLHTLHHLPAGEHAPGMNELLRVLSSNGRAVVIYAWGDGGLLMRLMDRPTRALQWMLGRRQRAGRSPGQPQIAAQAAARVGPAPTGTLTYKHGYPWARKELAFLPMFDILVWRTVNTGFMRTFIHERLLGRLWLRLLYRWEEAAPHLLGRIGQYPMFIFSKPEVDGAGRGGR